MSAAVKREVGKLDSGGFLAWDATDERTAANVGRHQLPEDAAKAFAASVAATTITVAIALHSGYTRRYVLLADPTYGGGYRIVSAGSTAADKALQNDLRSSR